MRALKPAHEQPRADEQHGRESHLPGYETGSQARAARRSDASRRFERRH